MKAIMISIKPEWCAVIMNGIKTIEVRKNKALAKAIQKLIDENGFADIYVYCSKSNYLGYISNRYVGKVAFKFRCYKVEEIEDCVDLLSTKSLDCLKLLQKSCLKYEELHAYLPSREDDNPRGYAIHISGSEIFDRPKELNEFYTTRLDKDITKLFDNSIQLENGTWVKPLTKAPQNFCYLEVE